MCDINIGDTVRINSDQWCDAGKIYFVNRVIYSDYSTATKIELTDGLQSHTRVVPYHWIEKVV